MEFLTARSREAVRAGLMLWEALSTADWPGGRTNLMLFGPARVRGQGMHALRRGVVRTCFGGSCAPLCPEDGPVRREGWGRSSVGGGIEASEGADSMRSGRSHRIRAEDCTIFGASMG